MDSLTKHTAYQLTLINSACSSNRQSNLKAARTN